jgi:hypothetical protein
MLCQGGGEAYTLSVTLAFMAVNVVGQLGISMIVAGASLRNFRRRQLSARTFA